MISAINNSTGVRGITFAKAHINDDIIDIEYGARINNYNTDSYCTGNSYGYFRQYYAPSMINLGLVFIHDISNRFNLFYCVTKEEGNDGFISGEKLAGVFESSLQRTSIDTFWEIVKLGYTTKSKIESISKDFNIINIGEDESNILYSILKQKDYPRANGSLLLRSSSIDCIERFTKKGGSKKYYMDFCFNMFNEFRTQDNIVNYHWFLFYISEIWQYNTTSVLREVVMCLNNSVDEWNKIDDVIENCSRKIIGRINNYKDEWTLGDVLSSIYGRANSGYNYDRNDIYTHVMSLLHLYIDNNQYVENINKTLNTLCDMNVFHVGKFFEYITDSLTISFSAFLSDFLRNKIIFCHYKVATRKQYYEKEHKDTHMFIIENNKMSALQQLNETTNEPRYSTMIQFLIDLKKI